MLQWHIAASPGLAGKPDSQGADPRECVRRQATEPGQYQLLLVYPTNELGQLSVTNFLAMNQKNI